MIKPIAICLHSFVLFLFGFFFGDAPGGVTGNFPKTAKAGTEFEAEIIVNKGSMGGFAKLQIEVPQGFTVKEVENRGANFSFASNVAKFIWTTVPSESEFSVKVLIAVDPGMSPGVQTISVRYHYLNNNAKEKIDMAPAEITIEAGDTPDTSPDNATTAVKTETVGSSTEPVATTNPTPVDASFNNPADPAGDVYCSRAITSGSSDNYTIEITIKRVGIKGFAKYQDVIPEGYIAVAGIKTAGSSFSISDGKAKFVWVALPPEETMTVSYILQKTSAAPANAKIEGEFSYLENEQTQKFRLPAQPVSVTGTAPLAVNTPSMPVQETKTETPAPVQTETVAARTSEPLKTEDTAPAQKKEGEVSYCVQIGAFHNAIASEVLSRKFNVTEPIRSEMADGYSKFMIGRFVEYKEARNRREDMKQKGCASAFVAAYNAGKRITVQEALMVTRQKWFR